MQKIWLPESLTSKVIENAHLDNTLHGGIAKSLINVREYFYWPEMVRDVKNFVYNCKTCKENKNSKQILRPEMEIETQTEGPFLRLYIYYLGSYRRS